VQGRNGLLQRGFQSCATLVEWLVPQIARPQAQQVEEHHGGGDLDRQLPNARRRRMQSQLQRLEVQPIGSGDHDLSIQHATLRKLALQLEDQLGVVPRERFLVPALDEQIVSVAEHQRAEPIPLRLEDPSCPVRELLDSLREHGQDRRVDGQPHIPS
jgi:hypothetical protein